MHSENKGNRIRNIIRAGGIFIICLSAFITVLFFLNRYYENKRMDRARSLGESVESRLIEYLDSGIYCTDTLDIICSEYGIREKEKLDKASSRFIKSSENVINKVLIFSGERLDYFYPSSINPVFVKDLIKEGNPLYQDALYAKDNNVKNTSDSFDLLSGERVFAIIQSFKEDNGETGYAMVIVNLDILMEKTGVRFLSDYGYNYCLYRTNPSTGTTETLSSFGEEYIIEPVTVDKDMLEGETWHIKIDLNGGWTTAAEKTACIVMAVILSLLIAFVFYLFMSLRSREKELRGLSFSDPLTKVRNSRAYTDALEELKENGEVFGIIYIDVNDFKHINDTYGHRTGDEVLHITAVRLANTIRVGDYVYRIGGDEFAIIIHDSHDRSFYEGLIRRMKDAMNRRINVFGNSFNVSISCGFARFPEEGTDYQSVIQVADSEMYKDKAAQKSSEAGGTYWLDHDVMTGLYNKDGFYRAVSYHLKEHDVATHVMVSTDIRNFKIINQLYGTGKGNDILIKEARLLEMEYGEEGSICGRINGDHFSILMDKEKYNEEDITLMINDFAKNAIGDGYRMIIQIGVYEITEPDISPATMIDKTTMALKSVKDDKEFEIVHYTDDMMKDTLIENDVLMRFDNALQNNEFKMYLQSQVDKDGNLLGAEALARWVSDGKVVSPADFIPVLEKTNQIYRLDEVIWEEAARMLDSWKGTSLENMTISVNISPKDIYYIDIEENFKHLRTKYNINPDMLKLEITETAVMLDRSDGSKLVDKLKEQGFEVEMDDFGSGYSSLNMLKDIKIDVLKIDMGFLKKTDDEKRSEVILDSVITMAKKLGMTVIAEGVESREQMEFLSSMGCDIFQGYYFSVPLPPDEFERKYMKD